MLWYGAGIMFNFGDGREINGEPIRQPRSGDRRVSRSQRMAKYLKDRQEKRSDPMGPVECRGKAYPEKQRNLSQTTRGAKTDGTDQFPK